MSKIIMEKYFDAYERDYDIDREITEALKDVKLIKPLDKIKVTIEYIEGE